MAGGIEELLKEAERKEREQSLAPASIPITLPYGGNPWKTGVPAPMMDEPVWQNFGQPGQDAYDPRRADDEATRSAMGAPRSEQVTIGPPAPEPMPADPMALQRVGQTFGTRQTILPQDIQQSLKEGPTSLDAAYNMQAEASDEEAAVIADKMSKRAGVSQLQADYYKLSAREAAIRLGEYRKNMDNQIKQVYAAQKAAASAKVDPDAFWKNRGMGRRVMATLAVMIGEAGRSFGNKANTALDIINVAVDRDIAAQRANIQGLKDTAAAKVNMLGQLRQTFADNEQAEAVARDYRLKQFSAQLRAVEEANAGTEIAAKAKETRAMIEIKRGQGLFDIATRRAAIEGKDVSAQTQMGIVGPGKDAKAKQIQGEIASATIQRAKELFAGADTVDAVAGSTSATAAFNERAAQYQQIREDLAYKLARLVDDGRLSNQDYEMAVKLIPTLTRALPGMRGPALKAFDELQARIDRASAITQGTYKVDDAGRRRINEFNKKLKLSARL